MFRTMIISILAFVAVSAFIPEASARRRGIKLNRRQRMHRKWSSGVSTSYLTTTHYNTCWTNSQRAITPDPATVNMKYSRCLSRRRYSAYGRGFKRHRRRIRNKCNLFANTLIYPTDYQQQASYVQCLRHTRYNLIRGYLRTVTCGHMFGKRHNRCVRRLNKKIASYGYKNVAHLTHLDSMYRNRYRGFRTRHPNHKFVKRYHSRHHARKRAIKRAIKAERRANNYAYKHGRKHNRKKAIRRAVKRERKHQRKKAIKRAIKRERKRARKKDIKREIKRERKHQRKKSNKRRRRY